jgi:hypothetical protein
MRRIVFLAIGVIFCVTSLGGPSNARAVSILLPSHGATIESSEATATRNDWIKIDVACDAMAGATVVPPCEGRIELVSPPDNGHHAASDVDRASFAARNFILATGTERPIALHLAPAFFSTHVRRVRSVVKLENGLKSSRELAVYAPPGADGVAR